jgi:hypothetical protein
VKGKYKQGELSESVESRRTVIQGDLNKGEEGISSRSSPKEESICSVARRRKPAAKNRRTNFLVVVVQC